MADKLKKYLAILQLTSYTPEFKDLVAEQILQLCVPFQPGSLLMNMLEFVLADFGEGQFKKQHLRIFRGIMKALHLEKSWNQLMLLELQNLVKLPGFRESEGTEAFAGIARMSANLECTKLKLIDLSDTRGMSIGRIAECCLPLLSQKDDKAENEEGKKPPGKTSGKKKGKKKGGKKKGKTMAPDDFARSLEGGSEAVLEENEKWGKLGYDKKKKGIETEESKEAADCCNLCEVVLIDVVLGKWTGVRDRKYIGVYLKLKEKLLSENWVSRQVSALLLKELLNEFQFEEFCKWNVVEFGIDSGNCVSAVNILGSLPYSKPAIISITQDLISRLFVGIISDHFTDYLDNNIATPVREAYGGALLAVLRQPIASGIISKELLLSMIDSVTGILDNKENFWILRYNALLIFKYLMECGETITTTLFGNNSSDDSSPEQKMIEKMKVLLLSGMNSNDDEIFILASQLISKNLASLFASDSSSSFPALLLNAILNNLGSSDDIDASAVHMLSLLHEVIQASSGNILHQKGVTDIEFSNFYQFMFHKLPTIRAQTYELIYKIAAGIDMKAELTTLLQYSLQGVAMEQNPIILKCIQRNTKGILLKLIKPFLLIKWVKKNLPLIQLLLNEGKITTFSLFIFPDSSRTSYYDLIPEPVSPQEIEQFSKNRQKQVIKFLSYLSSEKDVWDILTELYYYLPKCNKFENPKLFFLAKTSKRVALLLLNYIKHKDKISASIPSEVLKLEKAYPQLILSLPELPGIITDFIPQDSFEVLAKDTPEYLKAIPEISLMTEDIRNNNTANLERYFAAIQSYYLKMKNVSSPSAGSTASLLLAASQLRENTQIEAARLKVYSAATLVYCCGLEKKLPEKLNPIIRPLLNAIQSELDEECGKIAARALAKLQHIATECNDDLATQQKAALSPTAAASSSINEKIVSSVIAMHTKGFNAAQYSANPTLKVTYLEYLKAYCKCYGSKSFQANNKVLGIALQNNILKLIEGKETEIVNLAYKEALTSEIVLISEMLQLINCEIHKEFLEQLLKIIMALALKVTDTMPYTIPGPSLSKTGSPFLLIISQHLSKILMKCVKVLRASNFYSYVSCSFMKIIHLKSSIGLVLFSALLNELPKDYLDYLPYFVFPIISNFANVAPEVSQQAYMLFSNLFKILPINAIALKKPIPPLIGLEAGAATECEKEGLEGVKFLQTFLLAGEQKYDYKIEIPLKERLRNYQIEGVSWMAFLHRYSINCALCDDMGIGKTIQALALIANEMARLHRPNAYSLIVCPSTLTKNWLYEIPKFFAEDQLKGAIYSGTAAGSGATRKSKKSVDLKALAAENHIIITSYDKIRADIEKFLPLNFFYIVLDEAHIVKNAKAKITQAVKTLKAERKLILSGTPLHNNVTEIWSLFDFLNPGFLGSEQQFDSLYTKHLITNLKKINEKIEETKDFGRALESLKQRIAPFILRRTKNDVLKDLPQKIIQDSTCKLSYIQKAIFQELNEKYPLDCKGQTKKENEKNELMLQRIQWHLLACNHPCFVIEKGILSPATLSEITSSLPSPVLEFKSLPIEHVGKLLSLKEILHQCGIGRAEPINLGASEQIEENPISQLIDPVQHRALIFCQKIAMLDIIEHHFLKVYFDIKYLRLDSRVESLNRVDLARQFNDDPSIKVMLLTTKVGGYGLTLTGADTVIFYDHDWNPMNDLQAMDRTHRIGQKHTVNVYRLIMSDTIEEKVLCYQRFKAQLAKSLIENEKTTSDKLNVREMFESFAGKVDEEEEVKKAKKKGTSGESFMEDLAKKWAQEDAERGDLG